MGWKKSDSATKSALRQKASGLSPLPPWLCTSGTATSGAGADRLLPKNIDCNHRLIESSYVMYLGIHMYIAMRLLPRTHVHILPLLPWTFYWRRPSPLPGQDAPTRSIPTVTATVSQVNMFRQRADSPHIELEVQRRQTSNTPQLEDSARAVKEGLSTSVIIQIICKLAPPLASSISLLTRTK